MTLVTPEEVEEHLSRLVRHLVATVETDPPETIDLADAAGRILAGDLPADRDQPPFDRAAMDGIALPAGSLKAGVRTFTHGGVLAAGADPEPFADPSSRDACIEIMTGAAVPRGFDTVVRYEDLRDETVDGSRSMTVVDGEYRGGEHIHPRGADYRTGARLLSAGTRIGVGHVAVLASAGAARVAVRRGLRIAVLGTGDELVPVAATPHPQQIRASNGATIAAELAGWGFPAADVGICGDDREELRRTIAERLDRADVVLLTGAVSRGLYDAVPDLLRELGVTVHLHGVRQRPGKPLLVGSRGATVVLGLPGNPVSSLTSVRRYLVPALTAAWGSDRDARGRAAAGIPARLAHDVDFRPELAWLPAVKLEDHADGEGDAGGDASLRVSVVDGNGSGDFSQLAGSAGILHVPEDRRRSPAGTVLRFFPWAI